VQIVSEVRISGSKRIRDFGDSSRYGFGSLARNWPPFELKSALTGNNVLRCSALNRSDIQRREIGRKEGMLFFSKH
jgi:hypothetical protein